MKIYRVGIDIGSTTIKLMLYAAKSSEITEIGAVL